MAGERGRLLLHVRPERLGLRPAPEGRRAGQALIEHASQRIAVGATVDRLRADLPVSALVGGAVAENHDLETALSEKTPLVIAIVIALAAAAVAGLVNGWCVARLGLPSLVVTLAGLIGWRGAARVLVEDRSIGDFPGWFERLGQDELEPAVQPGREDLAGGAAACQERADQDRTIEDRLHDAPGGLS